jgi:uncharacterized protein YodC (DUF2158 family)
MGDLKAGNVVQLKSGGPKMTLGEEMSGGDWAVHWFLNGELKEATVPLASLESASS